MAPMAGAFPARGKQPKACTLAPGFTPMHSGAVARPPRFAGAVC
uniref:Uncharacterized protein n=1 Tax=Anopheles dirus TaxID=7168 RepID=A0A182NXJ2_9DIPT